MSESREHRRSGASLPRKAGVRVDLEGTKGFASLRRALLKVLVKHLLPTRRVDAGGVGDYAVEVEQHGVVVLACDYTFGLGVRHRSLSNSNAPRDTVY